MNDLEKSTITSYRQIDAIKCNIQEVKNQLQYGRQYAAHSEKA